MTSVQAKTISRSPRNTPLALIEAAERLFGTHGIEGVSLRQIRLEAGAGNNSAISYHFNDREKLVSAIWEYRLPAMDAARRLLLDETVRQGREGDAEAILGVLILPSYELKDVQGVHRYSAFFRHALRWRQGAAIRNAQLVETPASRDALDYYFALAPELPHDVMNYRLRHASCTFFDMVAERDADISEGRPVPSEQAFLADGIDMLRAICLR